MSFNGNFDWGDAWVMYSIWSANERRIRRYEEEYEEQQKAQQKPRISEENKARIKDISRDVENKLKGIEAEEKIHSYLNPGPFAKVPHFELKNTYLVDTNGMSHEIDFIEIRETGIFCIEVKNWSGSVRGGRQEKYWNVNGNLRRNPCFQNDTHIRAIHDIIGKKPHITSVIVMAQNNARPINIDGVINLSDFRSFMSQFTEKVISVDEMGRIYSLLKNASVKMSREQHLENIRKYGK